MYKMSNFVMNFTKSRYISYNAKGFLFLGFIFAISASSMKTEKNSLYKK